jgi:hypothetical protein
MSITKSRIMKQVTVRFTPDEGLVHEIAARWFSIGQRPTVEAVRKDIRYAYLFEGAGADLDPKEIICLHPDLTKADPTDDDYTKAHLWVNDLEWLT